VIQPRVDLVNRKGAHPRRRQLYRQRNTIEMKANRSQRRSALVGHLEIGTNQQRAIDEESCRLVV
jgi:hypothetical protein